MMNLCGIRIPPVEVNRESVTLNRISEFINAITQVYFNFNVITIIIFNKIVIMSNDQVFMMNYIKFWFYEQFNVWPRGQDQMLMTWNFLSVK